MDGEDSGAGCEGLCCCTFCMVLCWRCALSHPAFAVLSEQHLAVWLELFSDSSRWALRDVWPVLGLGAVWAPSSSSAPTSLLTASSPTELEERTGRKKIELVGRDKNSLLQQKRKREMGAMVFY